MASTTTEEIWVANGLTLNTHAFNITTLGGDRLAPPSLRGEDLTVPYRHGQVFLPRYVNSRTISLGMWVQGTQVDGSAPLAGTDNYRQFLKNWKVLRRALWSINEYDLTKTFYNDDMVLTTATARASFAGGLNPSMQGRAHGTFVVDLKLADPFFYGAEKTRTISSSGSVAEDVDGDFLTTNMTITFTGAATLTNTTTGAWIRSTGSGTANIRDGVVTGGAQITHGGFTQWFALNPGINALVLAGSGVTLKYREAYF